MCYAHMILPIAGATSTCAEFLLCLGSDVAIFTLIFVNVIELLMIIASRSFASVTAFAISIGTAVYTSPQ